MNYYPEAEQRIQYGLGLADTQQLQNMQVQVQRQIDDAKFQEQKASGRRKIPTRPVLATAASRPTVTRPAATAEPTENVIKHGISF